MALEENERGELAKFFAKRLTTNLRPKHPQVLPDEEGWSDLLERADLSGLARDISAACPRDDNVQMACEELRRLGQSRLPTQIFAASAAAAALAVVGLAAWSPGSGVDGHAGPALASTALAAHPEAAPSVKPTSTPDTEAPQAEAASAVTRVAAAAPPGIAEEAPEANPAPLTPCSQLGQGVVAYWYAGPSSPGAAGDQIAIDSWINVREELPTYRNDWDTKSSVQCVLRPGDVVTLHLEPEYVPRDSYWIPMRAQDVSSSS